MLSFLKYDIEYGDLLLSDDFDGAPLSDRWEISGGEWRADNGVLYGEITSNRGGLIYSKQQIYGDIILDFYGRFVPPCENDLNFTFRASGWDYEKNDAGTGYIGGLNGWWTHLSGLERYPGCQLRALSGYRAEPGIDHHIQTGIVGSDCFLFVDGEIKMAMSDPAPIKKEGCGRIGFGVYCSKAAFFKLRVYRPIVHRVERSYQFKF